MGFFDSIKSAASAMGDAAEKQFRKQLSQMSDSQLRDKYANASSDKTREMIEEEMRKRGM